MSDGLHRCPWPGCTQRVPRHLWGCESHWYRLPRELRDRCSTAWRSGGMAEHMEALEAIDEWLAPAVTDHQLPLDGGHAGQPSTETKSSKKHP